MAAGDFGDPLAGDGGHADFLGGLAIMESMIGNQQPEIRIDTERVVRPLVAVGLTAIGALPRHDGRSRACR